MEGIVKKVIFLKGLNCANCATKIERAVNEIDGIEKGVLDLVTMKLKLEINNLSKIDDIINQIREIVKRTEPHVEVIEEKEDGKEFIEETIDKKKVIRIGLGISIFILAYLLDFQFWYRVTLFTVSYLITGGDILLRAFRNIIKGKVFDENFLMTVATLGAFFVGEYSEAVAVMLFYQVGDMFQNMAVRRSRKAIKALLAIKPDYANLKTGREIMKVDPKVVGVGDIIVVKPGERIPLDGKVLEGESFVDTSALTGESVPKRVNEGEEVLSGFVNNSGLLTIEVTKGFKESTVSRILDLVENASSRKAQTENFITRFARYYTPAVVITALLIATIPPLVINGAKYSDWIYRALIFLVVSCPCALVISIPLGFFGGIGRASRDGILVKGGNYLEALNKVNTVVFDKTGTLTKGIFEVTEIKAFNGFNENDVLRYAALAEIHSNHPIAKSIRNKFNQSIEEDSIKEFEEIAGHGVVALIENNKVLVGNSKLLKKYNIAHEEISSSGTIVYVAVDGIYVGYLEISDEIKEDSYYAIEELKKSGVKEVIMLTGDNKDTAESVGRRLKIDRVYWELLPHQKVEILEKIQKDKGEKEKVVFVGDGINDAPVLARADIGMAMGGLGSDAAIEASDVVLMTDEPFKVVDAINIAKVTRKIVVQNIMFALGTKGIVLLLGAFGIATMWEAVFADVGVALIAVLNSIRILRKKVSYAE